jgi:hypothetical protein
MKILFDQGTPVPLRRFLPDHTITTAYEQGWSDLANGTLLNAAEGAGYQVFISTDQNLRYQQNLAQWQIAVIVLRSTSWPRIRLRVDEIREAVAQIKPGDYREIPI